MAVAKAKLELVVGLVVILVLALAVTAVFKSFNGDFGDNVYVTADIGQVGDSLDTGDIVTYRDIIIGEVSSFSADGRGGAQLRLRIEGKYANVTPGNVTAIGVPESLFGATKIQLLPPSRPSPQTLHSGDHVLADASPAASGLQTALTDAYDLLTAAHPAQLDAALTALATALQGQGANLGHVIDEAAGYLKALAPSLPKLDNVITSLATVTVEVAHNAPALLGSIANLLTPANAIATDQNVIDQLLDIAPPTLDSARTLISAVGTNFITIVTNEGPFLAALAANPTGLSRSITGFHSVADALNSIFHNGLPSATLIVNGASIVGALPAAAGQPTQAVQNLANPKTYTAAQCPRYPGANGPNCPADSSAATNTATTAADVLTIGANDGGTSGSIGDSQEVAAVRAVISSTTGLPQDDIPGAMDLLIGPLLRQNATLLP